jgi:hypothetical protein
MFHRKLLHPSSDLLSNTSCIDESWIEFYQAARRYISEDSKLYIRRRRDAGCPRRRWGYNLWIRKEKRTTLINGRVYSLKLWLCVWNKGLSQHYREARYRFSYSIPVYMWKSISDIHWIGEGLGLRIFYIEQHREKGRKKSSLKTCLSVYT